MNHITRKWIMGVLAVVLALGIGASVPAQAQESDVPEAGTEFIDFGAVFGAALPNSISYAFVTGALVDANPGGADCCIPDDVVVITIDGCLIGVLDSRIDGNAFVRRGPVSLFPGAHTVTYTNTISSVGPSGWFLETMQPPVSAGTFEDFTGTPSIDPDCSFTIDIKPLSDPNSINTKSNGVVPVAILGSASFDVTTVVATSLRFGPSMVAPAHDLSDPGVLAAHTHDANLDGFVDLVSHYRQRDTGIAVGDTSACLKGAVAGIGVLHLGCDSVNVVH